jgi:uncharacterized protein
VSAKSPKRPKHIPQRTCVGCRSVLPKRALIRLVRQPDGVYVDLTGKLPGRGAYLHNTQACWQKGLKGSLANALKVDLTPTDLEMLDQFKKSLPEDDETTGVRP